MFLKSYGSRLTRMQTNTNKNGATIAIINSSNLLKPSDIMSFSNRLKNSSIIRYILKFNISGHRWSRTTLPAITSLRA